MDVRQKVDLLPMSSELRKGLWIHSLNGIFI